MRDRIISLFLLFLALLTVGLITTDLHAPSGTATVTNASPEVSDQVIRLHILADSDSDTDQQIKLFIRDTLLPHLNAITTVAGSKDEALHLLQEQCDTLTDIVNRALETASVPYTATVTLTSLYFPVRIYGSQTYLSPDAIVFPPGMYDSIQVVLGSGEGHNWWCLAYPSLCFIDASYDYIPKETGDYKEAFATIKQSALERLFFGTAKTSPNDGEISVYLGSRLWELLKIWFPED